MTLASGSFLDVEFYWLTCRSFVTVNNGQEPDVRI